MIDFVFSHALPKVTAHIMADLPIVYVTDERLSEADALRRVVRTLRAAVSDGRWRMVRKVSDLMRAQPEFLVMRNTEGSNLMYLLCENSFTNAVDIFLEGPSSIRDMFYEKNNYSVSPLMLIVIRLTGCVTRRGEEVKETVDAIVEKVRDDGKHDVADDLLVIWRKNFYPSDTQSDAPSDTPSDTQSDTQSDTPPG